MLAEMTAMHVPVLAPEVLEALDPQPGETAVDCTFGAGGHSRLIAERLGPTGTLIAIDRDAVAEQNFAQLDDEVPFRTSFIRAGFAEGLEELRHEGTRVDMVLLDLGMSSMQIDTLERGFSYVYDAPLDMRMDPDQPLSAREVVNGWEERQLARALKELGEERYARQVARAIVRARPIETTQELVDVVSRAIPAPSRFGGGHPAKRTFQALRIEVNGELAALESALPAALDALAIGGRIVALAYHSLEDRRVKRFLADRAQGCICPPDLPVCVCGHEPEAELVRRGGIVPTPGEIESNPRARSARLRAARKLSERSH